jgi:hypothetical protein
MYIDIKKCRGEQKRKGGGRGEVRNSWNPKGIEIESAELFDHGIE